MKNILIIEDTALYSRMEIELLKQIFQELNLPNPSFEMTTEEKEGIKMAGKKKRDLIILDGQINPSGGGYGRNVLSQIDGEYWKKTIVISSDTFFLTFCVQNHIKCLTKRDLSHENLLPMVKEVLELK